MIFKTGLYKMENWKDKEQPLCFCHKKNHKIYVEGGQRNIKLLLKNI